MHAEIEQPTWDGSLYKVRHKDKVRIVISGSGIIARTIVLDRLGAEHFQSNHGAEIVM